MRAQNGTLEQLALSYATLLHQGDAAGLRGLFHPSSDLCWQEDGQLKTMTAGQFLELVGQSRRLTRKVTLKTTSLSLSIGRTKTPGS